MGANKNPSIFSPLELKERCPKGREDYISFL